MKNKSGVSLITLIITIIVVIILAVIVLRSGASDAPDQAAFSAFAQEMGELQDAVNVAMQKAKADEILAGNQRSEAQLYNFIARGGYAGFDYENKIAIKNGDSELSGDVKWLTMADAEKMKATLIYKNFAKETIGQDLPNRKVETDMGVEQEMSYFVTKSGTVFCWPPYVYDGKSYVNATETAKRRYVNYDNAKSYEELKETEATEKDTINIVIQLEDEIIVINNSRETYNFNIPEMLPSNVKKGIKILTSRFVFYSEGNSATEIRGVAEGHCFWNYTNKQ